MAIRVDISAESAGPILQIKAENMDVLNLLLLPVPLKFTARILVLAAGPTTACFVKNGYLNTHGPPPNPKSSSASCEASSSMHARKFASYMPL